MELPLVLPLELLMVLPPWISMELLLVLPPHVTSLGVVLPYPGVPCAQFIFYNTRPAHLTSSKMSNKRYQPPSPHHSDSEEEPIFNNPDGTLTNWADAAWWEDQTSVECSNCGSWSPYIWLTPCSYGFTRPGACDVVLCSNCADYGRHPTDFAVYCRKHYPRRLTCRLM